MHHAGVEPRDLEQVLDQLAEPVEVLGQEVERRLGPLAEVARGCSGAPRWTPAASSSGDRSSWLTSDANWASFSMRASSASAMPLNDVTMGSRSGSTSVRMRVSRAPPASDRAAMPTSPSGRRIRRLEYQPNAAPARTVAMEAPKRVKEIDERASSSERERDDLEVGAVDVGDGGADGQALGAVGVDVAHLGRLTGEDIGAQGEWEGVLAELGVGCGPAFLEVVGARDGDGPLVEHGPAALGCLQ